MSAEAVANAAYAGMITGQSVVIPGTLNWLVAFTMRLLPHSAAAALARQFQEER
jgi:short-subunit dehydrogenase